MAGEDLRGFAMEKAELFSSRIKDLLTSGERYVRTQFGVDLGLKPELCPTWFILLTTAAVGLLLAAVFGALLAGKKKQGCSVPRGSSSGEPTTIKAHFTKTSKPEEQKKRNRKKTQEKKTQSNGQPVTVVQEEVKVTEVVSKLSPQIKTEKVREVQAPVQVKKNKKKAKADVKPAQNVPTNDGKEPDDGAWETKVSNREKRQQRRKDKGPEVSGSPGSGDNAKTLGDSPVARVPTNTKKNRGNHESLHSRSAGKAESQPSTWREEPSVNGGRWTDISLKIPGQMGTMEGNKWNATHKNTHYRTQPEAQSWGQETQAWSDINGRSKTEINSVSFSMLGLNTTDSVSNSIGLQWTRHSEVDDEWSGFNGVTAVDPSSDWNAPSEHWGNYEEPPVLVTPVPPLKEQPATSKVSEDEKDTEDPAGGAAKSKKRRRKKKKTEEEAASEAQTMSTVPQVITVPKSQEPPVLASKKQNPSISSAQKKSEQVVEPPKPSQKKKVRRET